MADVMKEAMGHIPESSYILKKENYREILQVVVKEPIAKRIVEQEDICEK